MGFNQYNRKWKSPTYEIVDGKRKQTQSYITWNHMIQRCYNKNRQKLIPTYIGCTVYDEWLDYDGFYKWYQENYPYNINNIKFNLDKDILIKGNKIYSPNTCCFIPQNINKLVIKSNKSRGLLPIGVNFHIRDKIYQAVCQNNNGKQKFLGYYNTPEEAFQAYKTYKENLIKEVATESFNLGHINDRVYNALLNYEVEITD